MTRPLRIEFPGAVYHITSRGNERRDIFADDDDRSLFLELLNEAVGRFGWILTTYTLMSNHFHLVIELARTTLSTGMGWLNSTYSQRYNRRHDRVGHLLQGRFHAALVDKENYLLEVVRYVVLNPVRACMVERPEDHVWSSYRATAGHVDPPDWLAVDNVLALFSEHRSVAQDRYRAFVADAIGRPHDLWSKLVGQMYLGESSWVDTMKDRVRAKPRDSEHPRAQRLIFSTMADVIASVARTMFIEEAVIRSGRGGTPRMVAAWIGSRYDVTLNEIAAGLRLRSAGHVSDLIRACDRAAATDGRVRATLDQCLATLRGEEKTIEPKI